MWDGQRLIIKFDGGLGSRLTHVGRPKYSFKFDFFQFQVCYFNLLIGNLIFRRRKSNDVGTDFVTMDLLVPLSGIRSSCVINRLFDLAIIIRLR